VSISLRGASSIATDTAHIVFMEESLAKLCELRDIARSLDKNVNRSWTMILIPNALCILGAFTMGFGVLASVVTNNVAALGALANGMLPLRRIKQDLAKEEEDEELREFEHRDPSPRLLEAEFKHVPASSAPVAADEPDVPDEATELAMETIGA
jgi:hypothetical protein